MSTPSDPSLARPHRPVPIWVIAIVVLCATAFSLFSIAMVPSMLAVSSDVGDAQRQFLESQTTLNYVLAVATILGNLTGAVLLFLMKRQALYVFIGALVLALANTTYNIFVNNWLTAVGSTGLIVALAGWAVNVIIILYVWSLFRKQLLR
jgi:hypothetical protein